MIRLMPQDWQTVAYEAAMRGDDEAVIAALREINQFGPEHTERAVQAWMARTQFVMECYARSSGRPVAFTVEGEINDATGQIQIDPELAWAGKLFTAYVQDDHASWDDLFQAVPPGEPLDSAVTVTLKMLAVTADQAGQAAEQDNPDDRYPPLLRAARMARYHLN